MLIHNAAGWSIDFFCSKDRRHVPSRHPEDRELIDRETGGVDPSVLPDFGPGLEISGTGYELIERLNRQGWYITSWKARMAGTSPDVQLLMLRTHGLSTMSEYFETVDLRPEVERLLPQLQRDVGLTGRGLAAAICAHFTNAD